MNQDQAKSDSAKYLGDDRAPWLEGRVRYLCRCFGRESDYQDFFQEAIAAALRRVQANLGAASFKDETAAAFYILQCVRRSLALAKQKSHRIRVVPLTEENEISMAVSQHTEFAAISDLRLSIESLPAKARTFAECCYPFWVQYQKPRMDEIAKQMGISLARAYARHVEVLELLREMLSAGSIDPKSADPKQEGVPET